MDWLNTLLGKKFYKLFQSIPTLRGFSEDVLNSYEDLSLEQREDLLHWIDSLIEKLENQLLLWKSIKNKIKLNKNLKLIK